MRKHKFIDLMFGDLKHKKLLTLVVLLIATVFVGQILPPRVNATPVPAVQTPKSTPAPTPLCVAQGCATPNPVITTPKSTPAPSTIPVTAQCYSGGPSDPSPNNNANLQCKCPTTGCTGSASATPKGNPTPVPNPAKGTATPKGNPTPVPNPAKGTATPKNTPKSTPPPTPAGTPKDTPNLKTPPPPSVPKGTPFVYPTISVKLPTPVGSPTRNILRLIFGVGGGLAFLIIVIAGLQFVTSQGDPQKATKARNAIIYALVGLVVMTISFTLVSFVLDNIK